MLSAFIHIRLLDIIDIILVAMLLLDWRLTLVAFALSPVLVAVVEIFRRAVIVGVGILGVGNPVAVRIRLRSDIREGCRLRSPGTGKSERKKQ